jgi:hypothetical protein
MHDMHKIPHRDTKAHAHRRVELVAPIVPMRLGKQHETWVYAIGGMLCASGLGWLIAHYFFADGGQFGDGNQVSEPWWLRIHGAAAMGFLIVLGSLLPGHIARAWQLKKNLRTGIFMLLCIALLVLTGYALYYASSETLRPWISAGHWIIGIAATVGLPVHVWLGKRRHARRHTLAEHIKQSHKTKM